MHTLPTPRRARRPLLELPPAEVHLWRLDRRRFTEPLHEAWTNCLSDVERAELERRRHPGVRNEYGLTRAFVRRLLSRYRAVDPRDWSFTANSHGRPEISRPETHAELRFNLSHTDGWIVMIVAHRRTVGVDVEGLRRPRDLQALARRFFSLTEADDVAACPEPERARRFLTYWTLKEAFVKARGEGLTLPLDRFWFQPSPDGRLAMRVDPRFVEDPARWRIWQTKLSERHHLAACVLAGADEPTLLLRQFDLHPDGASTPVDTAVLLPP